LEEGVEKLLRNFVHLFFACLSRNTHLPIWVGNQSIPIFVSSMLPYKPIWHTKDIFTLGSALLRITNDIQLFFLIMLSFGFQYFVIIILISNYIEVILNIISMVGKVKERNIY
jgi:hypothetical protein